MNCPYPAHICKSNQPHLKPIMNAEFKSLSIQATKAKYNLENLTWMIKGWFNRAL